MLDHQIPGVLVRDDDVLPLRPRSRTTAGAVGAAGLAADDTCMDGLVARLRATISVYVRERRAAGLALERVLPEVRDLLRDAEVAEGWPDELGVLMGQVVRWTIEAYFDEPELRDVPRFY